MPIRLVAADADANYPGGVLGPMNAIVWGDLLWKLYDWDANLLYDWDANSHSFLYDNNDHLIPAHICRGVADAIEAHLDEFTDPEEREYWATQIPYWQHSGGFFQRGARII